MGAAMNDHQLLAILEAIRRAPQWVRTDLTQRDPALRTRAEDTLAAMIATGLDDARACDAGENRLN